MSRYRIPADPIKLEERRLDYLWMAAWARIDGNDTQARRFERMAARCEAAARSAGVSVAEKETA